ncbi:hypothetical protein BDZ45DRAFT_434009 [Acephala macrosclerotiorum]|nr:hypothetical protein BDZ45DRAFT_434009 [Acephala macrosclerotiorum]
MDKGLIIATDEISMPLLSLEISEDTSPQTEIKGRLNYNGPVGSHCRGAQILPRPKSNEESRTKVGRSSLKPTLSTYIQGVRNKTVHLGHAFNAVPDTQLGLTNDEIALLRHHQQQAASAAGSSSSRASSNASSQGLLLLDSSSLAALDRHFDSLMQSIQAHLDYLSEQSRVVVQQRYDHAGNAIRRADSEISKLHTIIRKLDEVEKDFDKVENIRDIVKNYRRKVEELENLERNFVPPPPTRNRGERNLQRPSKKESQRHLQEINVSARENALTSRRPMLEAVSESCTDAKDVNSDQSPASSVIVHPINIIEDSTEEFRTLCSTTDGTTWSTSSNDSNELGSESSESLCPTAYWRHHLILEAVMIEVYRLLQHNATTVHGAYGQGGGSSSGNSGSWMSGAYSSTNKSSLSSMSNAAGMKRGNDDGDFPPPDEDPDGYKRPRKGSKDDGELRRYACPFFKNDPRKNRQRRSCAGPGFNSISHLKYVCYLISLLLY